MDAPLLMTATAPVSSEVGSPGRAGSGANSGSGSSGSHPGSPRLTAHDMDTSEL